MNATRETFLAPDGQELAYWEMGEGQAVVLLHGLFSDARTNWIRYGHAAAIAAKGFRLVMPDLRAHGTSARPHDPAAYPPDVLASDGMALIAHLGLVDYDLGGYSLGGRTSARMVIAGARPRRLVIGGMGLTGLLSTQPRAEMFRDVLRGLGTHPRGSEEWRSEAFLKTTGGDPEALLPLLDSFVDSTEAQLRSIRPPTLVVSGADDDDNGSAEALSDLLADGRYVEIPGNHMSAVVKPELGRAIADFLAS
ncbi:alpha/beta fold hydrolase [Sphingosinicella ginsenosidimutans]|uniref:Alpha/beta hydrolase n=1 Tax=Allosphingosinicella ginsenosidimutans TaxID=1176539 RepID=A0A5C6TWL9_9SPHN|nr:alpha/beta fold hydrolase [Sphingosinicella ginsenosidimutans]TXC64301.1 alpha/beta hydrolase [Sphingosinicella ginsenosidimutans]